MIYFGPTVFSAYDGASGGGSPADEVDIFQSDDVLVLENRVNARGREQNVVNSRSLMGLQISGAGQGGQFTVMMLTNTDIPNGLTGMEFTPDDASAGIRVFLYAAETEQELEVQKQRALGRARSFISGFGTNSWRGCEMAGSSNGRVFAGLFVVSRTAPQ